MAESINARARAQRTGRTFSPYFSSGTPNATASATPSRLNKAASTSSGEIFSPPRLICEFERSQPVAPSRVEFE